MHHRKQAEKGAKRREFSYQIVRKTIALEQFSLSEDKQLEVTLYEHNGGRTLTFYVEPQDLLLAQKIDNLKLKW
nr:conjugative transposon protein TraN [Prevotella ihumii]